MSLGTKSPNVKLPINDNSFRSLVASATCRHFIIEMNIISIYLCFLFFNTVLTNIIERKTRLLQDEEWYIIVYNVIYYTTCCVPRQF